MRLKGYSRVGVASTFSFILAAVSASAVSAQTASSDEQETLAIDEIVVTGIRGSLKRSMDVKRSTRGVVDAISAEDMGKFPDTNLAESLQRITGVSIDRQNGEGSRVTVRGFGPDFNLVTLNGRQMPTSSILATDASSSRSFDFANLASEGVSGVQVYKTGRAAIPTGGIGSTINISTMRPLENPGLKATIGVKGVYDDSRIREGDEVTPEISGLYSNTFADDRLGVAVSGSYQKRDSGFAQAAAPNGWRGAYLGSADPVNSWGALPLVPEEGAITNRPGPNDVYGTPQAIEYSLNDITRERINGQATLQYKLTDTLTATVDYTYSELELREKRNYMSIWFNHGDTESAWTDGPAAGPIFYAENFGSPTDITFGAGLADTKNENNSFGANLKWEPNDQLTLEIDVHDSSAKSGANSPFGSNAVIGTAGFYVARQAVNFENDLPVVSLGFTDGLTDFDPSRQVATGSSFRNSYMRNDIKQAQFHGKYEFDTDAMELSVDFGGTYTENKIRSAFVNVQNNDWGGAGPASDIPDDIFEFVSLPGKFDELSGSGSSDLVPGLYAFDFTEMAGLLDQLYDRCGNDGQCRSDDFNTDRRTEEETYSAYMQVNAGFDVGERRANITAGLRYEDTDVTSRALVPVAVGTQWTAANEFNVIYSGAQDFTELNGGYEQWLPSVDFDIEFMDNVIFRASYSETIARPGLNDIQGGQTVQDSFRVDGGTGNQGDPGLLPFESKNYDVSLEWYYDDASYIAAGYFKKDVKNFIGTSEIRETPFNLATPFGGARYNAAVEALGSDSDLVAIREWIFANTDPSGFEITGTDSNGNTIGTIFGVPGEDPVLGFDITVPVNERSASIDGWEFALQHTFADSGFGVLLNYTIVDGDVNFDVTQPQSVSQFALVGLSDTANIVGFYDKDGIQVRVAYNWRDKFLNSTQSPSATNNPMFTESYGQVDINASYEFMENWTAFVEGINVTNETTRVHGRHPNQVLFATQTGARYNFGVRYTF